MDRKQYQEEAGKLLKEWRELAGKSIHEARRCTLPRIGLVELEGMEAGRRHLEVFAVRQLCRFYGRSHSDFYAEVEKRCEAASRPS